MSGLIIVQLTILCSVSRIDVRPHHRSVDNTLFCVQKRWSVDNPIVLGSDKMVRWQSHCLGPDNMFSWQSLCSGSRKDVKVSWQSPCCVQKRCHASSQVRWQHFILCPEKMSCLIIGQLTIPCSVSRKDGQLTIPLSRKVVKPHHRSVDNPLVVSRKDVMPHQYLVLCPEKMVSGQSHCSRQCCGAVWLFGKTAPAPTFSKNGSGSDSGSPTLEQSRSKYTSSLNIELLLNIFQGQKYKVKFSDVGSGST